jgi:two-component system, sensor histidine kinase and response regulator
MDGFALAEFIRSHPRLNHLKMILMTSDSTEASTVRVYQSGFAGCLVKPVILSELRGMIMKTLERRDAAGSRASDDVSGKLAPLRILLVEDAENNRLLIRSYLKETPFVLDEARNGQIAVEKYRKNVYDLVLMDMQMPVMDGYTATREIRRWERETGSKPTPVLALTAHAFNDDIERSLNAGCSAHLIKPIRKAVLLEAILDQTGREKV